MKRPTACVECGRQVHGTVTHGCKACGRPLCSRCLALGLGIEVKLGIYRCHRCLRRTSDLMFCPVCKRTVCMRCIILNGDEMKYAMGKWLCDRCRKWQRKEMK